MLLNLRLSGGGFVRFKVVSGCLEGLDGWDMKSGFLRTRDGLEAVPELESEYVRSRRYWKHH